MSVYENIAFGLRLRKMPKHEIDIAVKRAARVLEIEPYLERKPKQLSGGQRQRVALGRAIVRNPQVFLMDEPLSNLDAKLRVHMRSELIRLHKHLEVTTIYVTHDQTEAMTMASRIVVLKDGIIQQVDTPQRIYDYPNNMFVASFIGSPPMNFIDGLLKEHSGGLQFHTNRFAVDIPRDFARHLIDNKLTGKTVTLGIRPENIIVGKHALVASPNSVLTGIHKFSELMGADRFLHLDIGAPNLLVARTSPDNMYHDETHISVMIDMNKVLFFNRDSGERY
jgi:multiple sugar transport system ATP-binding protein